PSLVRRRAGGYGGSWRIGVRLPTPKRTGPGAGPVPGRATGVALRRQDRVVCPDQVVRVVRPFHSAEPPVRVRRVEARRIGVLLGEVQVLAAVLVRSER